MEPSLGVVRLAARVARALLVLTLVVLGLTHLTSGIPALTSSRGRRIGWLLVTAVLLANVWDEVFVWAHEDFAGSPDGGIHSAYFLLGFLHSAYVADYGSVPLLPRVLSHAALALGLLGSGIFLGWVDRVAVVVAPIAAFFAALSSSRSMYYVVAGYDDDRAPSIAQLMTFAWPFALQAACIVTIGAVLSVLFAADRRRRRSES